MYKFCQVIYATYAFSQTLFCTSGTCPGRYIPFKNGVDCVDKAGFPGTNLSYQKYIGFRNSWLLKWLVVGYVFFKFLGSLKIFTRRVHRVWNDIWYFVMGSVRLCQQLLIVHYTCMLLTTDCSVCLIKYRAHGGCLHLSCWHCQVLTWWLTANLEHVVYWSNKI